jgi:hypothetical protein
VRDGPRHQVTAFLPEPVAGLVDEVRSVWDPELARRIAAHVTLVHDASPLALTIERLRRAAVDVAAFRLELGAATRWEADESGIYLDVRDLDGGIRSLREHVMLPPLREPAGIEYEPHVTIVHPRTVAPARRREAWDRLRTWHLTRVVVIETVNVIIETPTGWDVVETFELRRGPGLSV